MGKSSAPTPPDPKQTSAAQTGTSVATALANANLQYVNQVTPNGNLTYSQSGTYQFKDPYTGQSYDIPQFTATQTLSPDQQKLYDLNNQTQQNLGQIGVDQSSKIGSLLNTPFDPTTANKAVEDKIDALGSARLDPQFAKEQAALQTQLTNQGIRPGSAAWSAAMTQFQQGKNDAYNQLYLTGNQQAFQQAQATRNQPINEITALMSGSQVSQPNYVNTNMPTIPTTDNAGLINSNYQQQQQNYQTQLQQQNALLGGLFGLGAAGVYKFSDRRLKKDIKKIGKTNDGQNLYSYKYKGSDEPQIGLMAQEVEKKRPDAVVTTPSGFKAVDYDKALGLMGAG
jgi:hypothetical protein